MVWPACMSTLSFTSSCSCPPTSLNSCVFVRRALGADLVGKMYRLRVLNVQLLSVPGLTGLFTGQKMTGPVVDLENGLGVRLSTSLPQNRTAWLRRVPGVAMRLPASHAACVAGGQWPSCFIPDCKTIRSLVFSIRWRQLGIDVRRLVETIFESRAAQMRRISTHIHDA